MRNHHPPSFAWKPRIYFLSSLKELSRLTATLFETGLFTSMFDGMEVREDRSIYN
jgi:hypothetical protein